MINTVTLNPAIDHILYLPRFRRNITNRIRSTQTTMGGKGTHVSLNLRLMGSPSRAFGFAFGKTGQRIIDMLREGGVEPYFIYDARGESRTNYLLVEEETKDATLVADRGPMPDGEQTEAFYRLLSGTVQDGDCLALSGDTSNFPDPWIYNHILERLSNKEIRVFLDASGKSLQRGWRHLLFWPNPTGTNWLPWWERPDRRRRRAPGHPEGRQVQHPGAGGIPGATAPSSAEDTLYRVYPKVQVYNTVGCSDCYLGAAPRL